MNIDKLKRIKEKTELKERSGMDLAPEFAEFVDTITEDTPEVEYPYTFKERAKKITIENLSEITLKIEGLMQSITGETLSEIPEARFLQLTHLFAVYTEMIAKDTSNYESFETMKPVNDTIFFLQNEIVSTFERFHIECDPNPDFVAGSFESFDINNSVHDNVSKMFHHVSHVAKVLEHVANDHDYASIQTILVFYFFNNISMLGHYAEYLSAMK